MIFKKKEPIKETEEELIKKLAEIQKQKEQLATRTESLSVAPKGKKVEETPELEGVEAYLTLCHQIELQRINIQLQILEKLERIEELLNK